MSKEQFWTLNAVAGVCAVLLLLNLILGQLNERTNRDLILNQNRINRAQQMQQTIQNLAVRIAHSGVTNPALNDVLGRHDLKVTLNAPETPPRSSP